MQLLLPIFPYDISYITPTLGFERKQDDVFYYHSGAPIYNHVMEDLNSFRFITSNLIDNGRCDGMDISKAFGVSYVSVLRYLKKFREEGPDGFFGKESRHGHAYKMVPEVISRIQKNLDLGKSVNSIAKKEHISEGTIRYALSKGILKKKLT